MTNRYYGSVAKEGTTYKWYLDILLNMLKKIKFDPYFTSFTKINSKLHKNLNIKVKALKSLEVNVKEYLSAYDHKRYFQLGTMINNHK